TKCGFRNADFGLLRVDGEIRNPNSAIRNRVWPGREADAPLPNSTVPDSHRATRDEPRPEKFPTRENGTGRHGDFAFPRVSVSPFLRVRFRVPKEGLKPSTSGL